MSNNNSQKNSLIKKVGLNWIPIILNDARFQSFPRPTQDRHREIKREVSQIGQEALDIIVPQFENLFANDDKRRIEIDSKASTLTGFSGITSSIIIGFFPFLLGISSLPPFFRLTIITFYLLPGICLIFTVILAQRTIQIGKASYMSPNPSDLLKLRDWNKESIFRQLAADLLRSYEYNLSLINDKAAYTIGAQIWFRNAILCLFLLMCSLTIGSFFNNPDTPEPVRVIVLTPDPSTSTIYPIFSDTPTLTSLPGKVETPTPSITLAPQTIKSTPTVSIISSTYTPPP